MSSVHHEVYEKQLAANPCELGEVYRAEHRHGGRKQPKPRNQAIMLFGINKLTEKTNPKRTQTKPLSPLFRGHPAKTNPNEANKSFRFGVPLENEPKLGICNIRETN